MTLATAENSLFQNLKKPFGAFLDFEPIQEQVEINYARQQRQLARERTKKGLPPIPTSQASKREIPLREPEVTKKSLLQRYLQILWPVSKIDIY